MLLDVVVSDWEVRRAAMELTWGGAAMAGREGEKKKDWG